MPRVPGIRSVSPLTVAAGAALLATGLLASAPVSATTVQYSLVVSNPQGLTGDDEFFGLPLATGINRSISNGSGSASIAVTPGMVKLRAETSWPGSGGGYEAMAAVTMTDTFILTSTAPPGSPVFGAFLTATVSVSGSLAQSNGDTSWRSTALLSASPYRGPGFSLVTPWSEADVSGLDGSTGTSGTALPATFSTATPAVAGYTGFFLVGQPVSVRLTFGASAGTISASEAGFARARLEDTLLWLGITARDADGNVIEGLSFVSASGVDWGNPPTVIPLPATGWLMLAGLGVIAARARRRRLDVRVA